MLRDIFGRDPTDPHYLPNIVETSNQLESVIAKVRMILYTRRGEVLDEPTLGMDLDDYLFETNINEQALRERFYAQVAKYIPDRNFNIDMELSFGSDGVKDSVYLYITINGNNVIGLQI